MIKKNLLILAVISSLSFSQDNQEEKEFIQLFLKMQELEKEIAELRNQVEILEAKVDYYESKSTTSIDDLEIKVLSLMSIDALKDVETNLNDRSNELLNSYEEAIVLIQKGNLVEALNALNNFVSTNQNEEQTPLAYFWLGELNLSQNNLALSIQNFNTLIGLYPNHWRVPLAKYKLGVIYLEQGDTERAKNQFEFVIKDYPDSSAARASRDSLDSLE